MDTVITFTPASLMAGILAVCAGISCIAAAVGWVIKGINAAKRPREEIEKRLEICEKAIEDHNRFFLNDKRRLESIEDGNRVTQKAILALLSHGIDGNDVEAMRSARDELQDYLIGQHTTHTTQHI